MIEYAPIARAMAQVNLSAAAKLRIKRKFDVAYMIAKENLAFMKMGSVCELAERHGFRIWLQEWPFLCYVY